MSQATPPSISSQRSKYINIRGLQYHVQSWGDPKLPTLIALHGWMDCGASFAYIASELEQQFHIIAPDLRGFGDTEHCSQGYWFPDYIADLDALVDLYSPNEPINLLGHSMGGNIVLMYAGIRPERVSNVISLDALGIANTSPEDSPQKYRQWLQQSSSLKKQKTYANLAEFEHAIQTNNPTLSVDVIQFLANSWSKPIKDDPSSEQRILKHDRKHRHTNPIRYNHDDIFAMWKQITANICLIMASDSSLYKKYLSSGRLDGTIKALDIPEKNCYIVQGCQHMLHLEKPTTTAKYIRQFFESLNNL